MQSQDRHVWQPLHGGALVVSREMRVLAETPAPVKRFLGQFPAGGTGAFLVGIESEEKKRPKRLDARFFSLE